MTHVKTCLMIVLMLISIIACSDHRLNRSDEEAMLVYRDCMAAAPPQLNSAEMSSTVSNSRGANKNTSIAARAQTRQEESQHLRCMQLGGWETN